MIRSKRLQNRITAGRFTLPAAVFLSLFCWVLTSILLPEIPVMKSNYPLWETIYNDWIPTWASAPKLSALRYNRLLPDRAEQHLCHYPYAGIRADSHLLPADICLSCHAPIICRRHCLDSISDIFVLPVQGLSTSTSGGHPILLVPVYRGGQSVLSATDIVHSHFLDRCIQFPGTHSLRAFSEV